MSMIISKQEIALENETMSICPRCGQHTLKARIVTNALSRVCDEYICDSCGTHEGIQNAFGKLTPREEWTIIV